MNSEQKVGKEVILKNKVTILRGKAGSGKTLLAVQTGLSLLDKTNFHEIIITRPTVLAGDDIGFLPGAIDEKLAPYIAPIHESMEDLIGKEKLRGLVFDELVRIIPLQFLRGRNIKKGQIIIVDEGQNMTNSQMKLLLTRICKGAKIIICGDTDQVDLKNPRLSGFEFACNKLAGKIAGFSLVTLLENNRDDIVDEILKVYDSNS